MLFKNNDRVGQIGRGYRAPNSLLKQGHPRTQELCPGGSWISPVRDTPQLPWATFSSAWSLTQQRSSSSYSGWTSFTTVCTHCFLTCCLTLLRRAGIHPLTPSVQILVDSDEGPPWYVQLESLSFGSVEREINFWADDWLFLPSPLRGVC